MWYNYFKQVGRITMKILLISDTHGDISKVIEILDRRCV